jgi:metal-responsive CopG/Arc/MetJ family transcriptional regulator
LAKLGCVDIQVRNIPISLLEEFDNKVVKSSYPAGRSEAIRDLMRRKIEKVTS